MVYVYRATSPSKKSYIGITSRKLSTRISEHHSKCKKYNTPFYSALRKYKDSFIWEIIEKCDSYKEAAKKERIYINKEKTLFPKGYNSTLGGEGALGFRHSKETKKLISLKNTGRKFSQKTKKLLSHRAKQRNYTKAFGEKLARGHGKEPFYVYRKDTMEFIGKWLVRTHCAKDLGLNRRKIQDCLQGKTKSTGGYIFINREVSYRTSKF